MARVVKKLKRETFQFTNYRLSIDPKEHYYFRAVKSCRKQLNMLLMVLLVDDAEDEDVMVKMKNKEALSKLSLAKNGPGVNFTRCYKFTVKVTPFWVN